MSDEPTPEPQHFRDFDHVHYKVIRCDRQDPMLKEHVRNLEAFLSKQAVAEVCAA